MNHRTLTLAVPTLLLLGACFSISIGACASTPKRPAAAQLDALRGALHGSVASREQNRENSELVQEVVDSDALMRLHRHEVAERVGKGEACSHHALCAQQGFLAEDWYYDVGVGDEASVGKRPVLIVGFDRHGVVERTYNLRVH